ncbi:hypothetical protein PV08_00063 [Exophiala spinifera]|uniref:Uncharacterized protein n=1 Tax=Exophiala spinifera TaxID=91928 RepID=A0A0D1YW60_9EURO|nr:uncharacterized protein PV08_00063 [Exophiala spinifera]KIW19491.1 hypothetical protein PV08_00063 [Exophiala spinifera]
MDTSHDGLNPVDDELDSSTDSQDEVEPQQSGESLLNTFIQAHSQPSTSTTHLQAAKSRLPYPVIITQRRPGHKRRGFIKAYAPVLEQYGIDQDTFIEFIRATNKAMEENKLLVAVQLAAAGTGFVPNHIALGVSIAVQFIAGAIAQAEAKWRTNSFLDRINDEFFRPRGLFCLLMCYNPIALEKKDAPEEIDAVSKAISPSLKPSFGGRARRNLRDPVAATVEGEENLPANTAPLVYLEKTESEDPHSDANSREKQNIGDRLNKYFDKRAQARYAKESNGDILSNPEPVKFKNRYLDPTSAASNGGLLGLVSGGKLTRDPEKTKQSIQAQFEAQERAIQEQQSIVMAGLQQQLQAMSLSPAQQQQYIKQYQDIYEGQLQQVRQQSDLFTKGKLHRRIDVLYLMIVDMPSDEEMETARTQLRTSGQTRATNKVKFATVAV